MLSDGFNQASTDSVVSLIAYAHSLYGTRNFAFYDDGLLLNKETHIIPILKRVIRMNLILVFHTPNGLHDREINANLASLLWRAHVHSLFLCQESFDEDFLAEDSPKVSPGDLDAAVGHLTEAGYFPSDINVYLMAEIPGQSIESQRESIRHVRRLGAKPRLAYFSSVPGTSTWEKLDKLGIFEQGADPLLLNKAAFPYIRGDMSPENFTGLKELAYRNAG